MKLCDQTSRLTVFSRLAALFLLAVFVKAQTSGSISGRISDPASSPVLDAPIVLRNTETGALFQARTNSEGPYSFPAVPVGKYDLSVDAAGLQRYQRTGVVVDAHSTLRLDAQLQLGTQDETVTVADSAVAVETANVGMGDVISSAAIAATPLNGRSFTDLLSLQPGVVPISSAQPNAVVMTGVTSTPPSGDLNPGTLSVNGQRDTANGFSVNGSDTEEDVNLGTSIIPNLDSIGEFRILTNNFTAEYGNYSGGQILVVTKGGTNEWHGDTFEYLRNTLLDARHYFSSSRAKFDQSQFGGVIGGPIRHDKVFVFGDYQGTRMVQGIDTG